MFLFPRVGFELIQRRKNGKFTSKSWDTASKNSGDFTEWSVQLPKSWIVIGKHEEKPYIDVRVKLCVWYSNILTYINMVCWIIPDEESLAVYRWLLVHFICISFRSCIYLSIAVLDCQRAIWGWCWKINPCFLGERIMKDTHAFQFQLAWKAKLTIVNGMYKATV